MTLIMPDNLSDERKRAMTAYGAELILVSENEGWKVPETWRCKWKLMAKDVY